MNQKLKLAVPALGVIVFLVIGIVIFNSNKNTPEVATDAKIKVGNENKVANKSKPAAEEKIITTSSVIGDKETDKSINAIINDALSENDINSELEDIELAMSDEEELNQINNLFNENEL